MIRMLKRAPWIALGAAAAWLLDGERGAARRAEIKDTMRSWTGPRTDPLLDTRGTIPPAAAR